MKWPFITCENTGHQFEPRFDTIPTRQRNIEGTLSAQDVVEILHAMSEKRYVHDICVKCGKTVKREPPHWREYLPAPTAATKKESA